MSRTVPVDARASEGPGRVPPATPRGPPESSRQGWDSDQSGEGHPDSVVVTQPSRDRGDRSDSGTFRPSWEER